MAPKILDDLALHDREQEIINAAIVLIEHYGIEHLTMDKVVNKVTYSKGTVYKHFDGKEDLLLAISNYAMAILADLFWRAFSFNGCARERMLLLNFSYLLYSLLYPALFQTVVCSKTANVFGKSSEKRLKEQEQLELKLLGSIHNIIDSALTDKSLTLPQHMSIQQLCFTNWSMAYGTISLLSGVSEQCSGSESLVVEVEIFNQSNLLFDGLNWLPLAKNKNYSVELKKAIKETFPQELLLLAKRGRILTF